MKYLRFVIFLAITLIQAISSAALPAPINKWDEDRTAGIMDTIKMPSTGPTAAAPQQIQTSVYGIPVAAVAPSTAKPVAVSSTFNDPFAEALPKKSKSNTIPVSSKSLPMLMPAESFKGPGSNLITGSSRSGFMFLPEMPWMPSFEPLELFPSMRSHLEPIQQRLRNMFSVLSGGLLGGFADKDFNTIQRTEPVTPETSGYPLSEFEDISKKDIPADAPENKGYLVHHSDSGRKWRTKNKDIIDQILSGDDSLIADGHTQYTSSDGETSFYRTHLVIVNDKVVSDPANLTNGGKILPFDSGLDNNKSETAASQSEMSEKLKAETNPEISSTKANESEQPEVEMNREIPLAKADEPEKSKPETNSEIPIMAELPSVKNTPTHAPLENEPGNTLTHPPMKNKSGIPSTHPPTENESNDSFSGHDDSDEEVEIIGNAGNSDSNFNKPTEIGNTKEYNRNSSPTLITNPISGMGSTISETGNSKSKSSNLIDVDDDPDASVSHSYSISSSAE